MPGTPAPVGVGPNGLPPFWNATLQAIQGTQQAVNGLAGGAPAGWVVDQYGNVTELSGANLNQIVTIGAAYQQAGVQVGTGIANGTAGRAVLSGPSITTITLTQGSTSATVGTVTGASLSAGQVIGAALVNDPTSVTPTAAITPGTTIASVSGSSVTLSQGAAESGTSLYCAATRFVLQQDSGWVALTLTGSNTANFTYSPYAPAARLINDRIYLCGAVNCVSTAIAGTYSSSFPVVGGGLNFTGGGVNSGGTLQIFLTLIVSGRAIINNQSASIMWLDGLSFRAI